MDDDVSEVFDIVQAAHQTVFQPVYNSFPAGTLYSFLTACYTYCKGERKRGPSSKGKYPPQQPKKVPVKDKSPKIYM